MQVSSWSMVVPRRGLMAYVGARAIGGGLIQQWHRQVCVKMASTALIFSALQPVRPALHHHHHHLSTVKQEQVGGRVARGNQHLYHHNSNLLLSRQCASMDPSIGTVLLETEECADGSVLYKFGSLDQKCSLSVIDDPVRTEGDEELGQCEAQLTMGASNENLGDLELSGGKENFEPVIVNGIQPSETSLGLPSVLVTEEEKEAGEEEGEEEEEEEIDLNSLSISDGADVKAGSPGLAEIPNDSSITSGLALHEETPMKDVDVPETKTITRNGKKDRAAKERIKFQFISGAAMIPHPDKAATGGEDAFFIEGSHWIGVADGVGGWALEGINAGNYARELMRNCAELAREAENDSHPKTVLIKSFSKTMSQGSTTVVMASIDNKTLNVVNMGDTGFLLIRDGSPVDRSVPMQRGFNFPYQIGSVGDDPSLAEVYRVPVKKGDVLVLGSDGLFDNLFEKEIVHIVNRAIGEGSDPEVVAEKLARHAHKVGGAQVGLSPFAREAQRVGYSFVGGKMDDITAVVSFIS